MNSILLISRSLSPLPPWGEGSTTPTPQSQICYCCRYWPHIFKFGMYTLYHIANGILVSFFEFTFPFPLGSPSRLSSSRLPQVEIMFGWFETLFVCSVAVKKRNFHVSFLFFSKSPMLPFLKYLWIVGSFGLYVPSYNILSVRFR